MSYSGYQQRSRLALIQAEAKRMMVAPADVLAKWLQQIYDEMPLLHPGEHPFKQ